MKPIRYLVFILLMAILLISAAPIQNKLPFRLVTLEFKPFIWCEDNVAKGIDADIIAELFRRLNTDYTIECLPWKRAIGYAKKGKADGLFSAYYTKDREAFIDFLKLPLHYSVFTAFVRKDSPRSIWNIDAFPGSRININRGYRINPTFDSAKNAGTINVHESESTRSNLLMLLKNRADVYINDITVVRYMAEQLGMSNSIKALTPPLNEPKPAFLAISKATQIQNRARVIDSLNSVLKDMWEDGTIEKITSSYIKSPQNSQK